MEMETTFHFEFFRLMKSVLLASIYLCPFCFKEASSQSANYDSTSLEKRDRDSSIIIGTL